ncbi:putative cupin superfamily protein [Rhizobium sp. BK316]|uniref:cupin domain-containing protein n=1 Tax=Rhizobium sp. BK316 TaxID=2587053 RepID=UPI0017C0C75C|nr:cupin domain-containing protein [Rhizobium sp. BK316]MBB3412058.1 putative cupin superfamily protein [Rhizobium sp. BK316]
MSESRIGSLATAPRTPSPSYEGQIMPERFAGMAELRLAKPLLLTQFGVNHVRLEPGAWSSLRHWHAVEDEFIYVLEGTLTLLDDNGLHELTPGMFAAFPAGEPNGHHIRNRSDQPGSFLAVGSRRPGEETIHYPDQNFGPIRK